MSRVEHNTVVQVRESEARDSSHTEQIENIRLNEGDKLETPVKPDTNKHLERGNVLMINEQEHEEAQKADEMISEEKLEALELEENRAEESPKGKEGSDKCLDKPTYVALNESFAADTGCSLQEMTEKEQVTNDAGENVSLEHVRRLILFFNVFPDIYFLVLIQFIR